MMMLKMALKSWRTVASAAKVSGPKRLIVIRMKSWPTAEVIESTTASMMIAGLREKKPMVSTSSSDEIKPTKEKKAPHTESSSIMGRIAVSFLNVADCHVDVYASAARKMITSTSPPTLFSMMCPSCLCAASPSYRRKRSAPMSTTSEAIQSKRTYC